MIVDSHVHLLPARLGTAIRAFFAEQGMPAESWRYPIDHDAVTAALAAEGVDEAWSLPYARRPDRAAGLNQSSADTVIAAAEGPVRIVGGATVHPGDHDPVGVVRAAVEELGLRVLKLHCSVGDYRPDDPGLDGVWDYAGRIGLPVVVHAGHAVSGHTDAAEIEPLAAVADRWPDAPIVVAHCGHHAVDATLDLVASRPNVHADLTPVVFDPVPLPGERVPGLASKLLFGSDCPNTAVSVTEALDALRSLRLDPAAFDAVTGGNAARLQAAIRA